MCRHSANTRSKPNTSPNTLLLQTEHIGEHIDTKRKDCTTRSQSQTSCPNSLIGLHRVLKIWSQARQIAGHISSTIHRPPTTTNWKVWRTQPQTHQLWSEIQLKAKPINSFCVGSDWNRKLSNPNTTSNTEQDFSATEQRSFAFLCIRFWAPQYFNGTQNQ